MPRLNLKQIAYNTIKENIVHCRYEPNSFLNEEQLCQELNMSRTPVRDALGRLEQEGLLKILPKKGFIITPLTISDMNMVYEARMLLEPFIIANYCQDLSPDVLQWLTQCYENEKTCVETPEDQTKEQNRDSYYWDNEFHQCLIGQCTNTYFTRLLNDANSQNSRIRINSGIASVQRQKATLEEHHRILEALKQHDPEGAAEAMRDHLVHSRQSSFGLLSIDVQL